MSVSGGTNPPFAADGRPVLFPSHCLRLGLFFASSREEVGLQRRGFRRGRGKLAIGAVFRLQSSENVELALAGPIGLAHAEHLDHVGGPQAPLDGALDVAECVGRIAVAGPTKRLIEENHLVGVAVGVAPEEGEMQGRILNR